MGLLDSLLQERLDRSHDVLAKMLIKVKTLTGKEIEIDIEPTDKVERIKERVEEKEGIPPPQQRLIFSGKQMNDEKIAADYKVCEMDIVDLKTNLLISVWTFYFSNSILNAGSRRFRLAPCPCPQRRQLEELQSFKFYKQTNLDSHRRPQPLVQDA